MTKRLLPTTLLLTILLLLSAGAARADICTGVSGNLLQNCGFETGDPTGWVLSSEWSVSDAVPHSGTYYAVSSCGGAACIDTPTSYVYQDVATTPGRLYDLTFYFTNRQGVQFEVAWGAAGPLTPTPFGNGSCLGGTDCIYNTTDAPSPYTEVTVLGLPAVSTTMRLEFFSANGNKDSKLDDVSLVQQAVPEPASALLLAGALTALVYRRRKR
jgi:hypothetical protein